MELVRGRVLVPGTAEAPLLPLTHPISFWGGVDPATGEIVDPRQPQHGRSVAGTILAVPSAVGSSSSSAVALELVREGRAPAGIVMGRADAILALGIVVAGELGYPTIPVVEAAPALWAEVREGTLLRIGPDGRILRVGG